MSGRDDLVDDRHTRAKRQCGIVYAAEFGAHTQLAAALGFLSRHKGQVADVTIDIGANDLDNCISGTNVNASCLEQHLGAAATNIAAIVRQVQSSLRQADPQAQIIAMNYYDPFLGLAFSPGGTRGPSFLLRRWPRRSYSTASWRRRTATFTSHWRMSHRHFALMH